MELVKDFYLWWESQRKERHFTFIMDWHTCWYWSDTFYDSFEHNNRKWYKNWWWSSGLMEVCWL